MQCPSFLARLLPLDVEPFRVLGRGVTGVGRQGAILSAQPFQVRAVPGAA
ncbi:hypothetical protein [Paenarthrobacter ureafaciens]|nr:hypothetical protein [Paenarthrobacter ureafaciens]MEC3853169.1 hypothetical protein [Paenarthrobacter ureafaciens]